MNIAELKKTLEQHPNKKLRFILPNEGTIPSHFHITEVLQAWVAANDEDHSLEAGKLAKILGLAGKILPSDELSVEVEFEAPYISQFPIESANPEDDAIVFRLTVKHTDCLAKEQCGLESSPCCSTEGGCC
jgi:hypothetical protein